MTTTTTTEPPAAQSRPSLTKRLAQKPIYALIAVFVLLYLITATQDHSLLSVAGVRSILLLACPLAIFAAAQTLCMLTGGIDLSSSMIANFAAYVAANQSGAGPVTALGLAFGVGLLVGVINGVGVGIFRVNALIMTLGMSSVLVGVVTVGLVGSGFLAGSTRLLPMVVELGRGTLIGPIPNNAVIWILASALLIFGLSRTGLGRSIYAVGDNPLACRLAGMKVWQVYIAVYAIAGVLAGLAGLLFSGISGSVGPDQTNGYLLPSIAAAVIGGTSILGGLGGYAGTIVGALILTVLNRLLLNLNTMESIRQIVYGLIVLALAWVYVRLSGQRSD